ncbi:MAG: hypothetical protein HGA28_06780, partial [Anaerolineaceae bacterium]|nr:hypothetical protein [Anaerolineaceae bacterium]
MQDDLANFCDEGCPGHSLEYTEVGFNDGYLEIDEIRSVPYTNREGKIYEVVIGRSAEMRIVDKHTRIILASGHIPYGANLYSRENTEVKKGDMIADWDPFNAVILSEVTGAV